MLLSLKGKSSGGWSLARARKQQRKNVNPLGVILRDVFTLTRSHIVDLDLTSKATSFAAPLAGGGRGWAAY